MNNTSSSKPSVIEKKLLHYTGKAIADFNMIQKNDRVMVCLSGGKDSFTLLTILNKLRQRSNNKFDLFAFTLDQAQPGWNDTELRQWLTERHIPHDILTRDTYSIVKEKIPEGQTYCSLCSRLRRGIIYRYAEEKGFNKIALGHHRDDLIRTLLMSIFYNGDIRSMPPKLLSDNKKHIVIRPLCYVQERDIITFAQSEAFPIIPCNLCGSQDNLMRKRIGKLIDDLAEENQKIPSNILHALQSIKPSQLMDQQLWPFKQLEQQLGSVDNGTESPTSPNFSALYTETMDPSHKTEEININKTVEHTLEGKRLIQNITRLAENEEPIFTAEEFADETEEI